MLFEICSFLKNFFIRDEHDIHTGKFNIVDGNIEPLDFLVNGQYFRIVGSALNDGVYKYGEETLVDEEFDGAVWAMYLPPLFVALAAEIASWTDKNADVIASPYQSESFGGYSYSKGGAQSGAGVGTVTWQSQFAARLNPYRRLSVL